MWRADLPSRNLSFNINVKPDVRASHSVINRRLDTGGGLEDAGLDSCDTKKTCTDFRIRERKAGGQTRHRHEARSTQVRVLTSEHINGKCTSHELSSIRLPLYRLLDLSSLQS